jgi:hypothetical protein
MKILAGLHPQYRDMLRKDRHENMPWMNHRRKCLLLKAKKCIHDKFAKKIAILCKILRNGLNVITVETIIQ